MDEQKIASFICSLRKEKGMTQKELAEQLNITDKAVSKWERGLSYPDVTLIMKLAEVLGVTATELLKGEKEAIKVSGQPNEEDSQEKKIRSANLDKEEMIKETLNYANNALKKSILEKERIVAGTFSCLCLMACFVCALCDLLLNDKFTWSLIAIGGVGLGWCLMTPFIRFKKKGCVVALVVLTLLVSPYLYLIEYQVASMGLFNERWFIPMALPMTLIGTIYLWIIYFVFKHRKLNIYYKCAIACMMIVPLQTGIYIIIGNYCKKPWLNIDLLINIIAIISMTVGCVIAGSIFRNKAAKQSIEK